MPSFIWEIEPKEAYENPYEYPAQEQFLREAKNVLDGLFKEICSEKIRFKRDERSKEKAIWMLHIDALDSLRDCLRLLQDKKHRVAARVFRDVIESLDLAALFFSNTEYSKRHLDEWFNDEIIPNRVYRDYLKNRAGKDEIKNKINFYRMLSKITHRTYRTLAYGYVLGHNKHIIYEGQFESDFLIPPQTISMYLALLADFIKLISKEIKQHELINTERINQIWFDSLEKESVPRRFVSPKQIFERAKKENRVD